MHMDEGLDTGPILSQRPVLLTGKETTGSLTTTLAQRGAELLIPTLEDWAACRIQPRPQAESSATYAPLLKKEDGLVRWEQDAATICRHIRAMQPWPGALTMWNGRQLKVLRARPIANGSSEIPGSVIRRHKDLAVVAGSGVVILEEVQLAGKRALPAVDFVHGNGAIVGAVLHEPCMVS